jgi:SpoIID/LytB domain protein
MTPRTPSLLLTTLALFVATATPALANDGAATGAPPDDLLERTSAGAEMETGAMAQMQSVGDVVVTGGGWGHGIGMPQWGAQAMAQAGHGHEAILKHYYSGAQIGAVAPSGTIIQHAEPIHVGVAQNQSTAIFTPDNGQLTVCLGSECQTANAGESWTLTGSAEGCQLARGGDLISTAGDCSGGITWGNQPNTRVRFTSFSPQRTYARGEVRFTHVSPGVFHVTVLASMDEYLLGLAEVPNSWHPEALKAQAVAARTFALYRIWWVHTQRGGLWDICACQLRSTTADQAYRGWEASTSAGMTEGDPANGAKWTDAVIQTSGKAMWHTMHKDSSRALEAYYFSSTGQATENNEDRWGGSPYEYLRSRPDQGSRPWPPPSYKSFSYADFAQRLGFGTVTWVDIPERFASGRPKRIEVQGFIEGSHQTKNFTSAQFQSALGLHSQWVWSVTGFVPPKADKVVLHDPTQGTWTYRGPDGSLSTIYFGNPGDRAFMGDWNCNGVSTPGLFRQSDGYVYLRNSNTQGIADISFFFGNPGDVPIVGDFNGNGCDTVSIYRPSEARFYIINKLGSADQGLGAAEYSFLFGNTGDVPFVGDWNGNGIDTPGLRRPTDGFVYLRNTNTQGIADISFFYGNPGDVVFAGDWNADGGDTIGLYRPSNGTVYLRNHLSTGIADFTFPVGTGMYPAAGDF